MVMVQEWQDKKFAESKEALNESEQDFPRRLLRRVLKTWRLQR